MPIDWHLTLAIGAGRAGDELHYAGTYRGVPVAFVRLPRDRARIYVEQTGHWRKRPQYDTEAQLIAAIDARLGNSELNPKPADVP